MDQRGAHPETRRLAVFEVDRCRRTKAPLVVAYADVIGLKALNNSEGHGAGDELLQRVVALITAHLRPYDLVVRIGGDEFLCAMSNMTLDEAQARFRAISSAPYDCPIRTGFAELGPDDSAEDLIARADSQLVDGRGAHHSRSQPDGETDLADA